MNLSNSIYKIFLLFFISFGLIIYLQYISYTTRTSLIQNNKDLIEEMEFANNIQFFQTHLILLDKNISELNDKSVSLAKDDLERELNILQLTLNYIKTYLKIHNSNHLADAEFYDLIRQKLDLGKTILNEIKLNQKSSKSISNYFETSENIDQEINSNLLNLEENIEDIVLKKSDDIIVSERLSLNINIGLFIISSLLFGFAIVYIHTRIKKQNQLIGELNIAQEKEKKLNKIKDDFLSNMSHEIRTPLNAILGFTHLLENETTTEKASSLLQTIKQAGIQLLYIINQILDISKIEEGMMRIEKSPFNLSDFIQKVDDSFRDLILSKNLIFNISKSSDIDIELLGDEYRLNQILANLLNNALKFTHRGSISLDVVLNQIDDKSKIVQFKITDTGIGIEKEKQHHIFERFEQAESATTRKYGGTGLGLSIVKQLVDLFQGRIELYSQMNQGSTFIVSIPFEMINKNQPKRSHADKTQSVHIPSESTILVVEDNLLNIQLIQNWFEKHKIRFLHADNGLKAIDLIKFQKVDLILMDIQMPLMDGYQCTDIIRQDLKLSTPIIGISAHSLKKDKLLAFRHQMNGYLTKPLEEKLFINTIAQMINYSNTKQIDITKLEEMSSGNSQFLTHFLNEFLRISPIEIDKLTSAFEDENIADARFIAHSLKTNFSYLGIETFLLMPFESIESSDDLSQNFTDLFHIQYLFELSKREAESILSNKN